MSPLSDQDLLEIMENYAAVLQENKWKTGSALTDKNKQMLLQKLKAVDPGLCRPLYAIFLADAYINCNDMEEWKQKDRTYYRTEFDEFLHVKDEIELSKRMCKNLYAIIIGINEYDLEATLEFSSKANYADIMQSIKDMCSRLSEKDNLLFFSQDMEKKWKDIVILR